MHLPDFLIDRYKDWKNNIFPKKENLFKTLEKKGQKPKAMIISCCDSRINPNSIFEATEGDFFIHRNVANLIPSLDAKKVNYETLSAVEFATKTLNISDIIVLGHSCCGGIEYAHKVFFEQISDNNSFRDRCYLFLENTKNGTLLKMVDSLDLSTNFFARYEAQDQSYIQDIDSSNLEVLRRLKSKLENNQ